MQQSNSLLHVKFSFFGLSRTKKADYLLLYDLQDLHGAGLDTDAAGDALGSGRLGLQDHNVHGAGLNALAAADTVLLVDHVDTGLGILGNGLVLAGTHALAALDAGAGLGLTVLCNDLDAAEGLVSFLVESLGAGTGTLQACHTLSTLLNRQFLHSRISSLNIITDKPLSGTKIGQIQLKELLFIISQYSIYCNKNLLYSIFYRVSLC